MNGCQKTVEDWSKLLRVHSLVLEPQEDTKPWLKFASLCRQNGRLVSPIHRHIIITIIICLWSYLTIIIRSWHNVKSSKTCKGFEVDEIWPELFYSFF